MDQIILRAYKPKKEPVMVVCPLEDKSGNVYTGQGERGYYELLSEAERREFGDSSIITPDTRVKIMNDYTLDMDNPIQAANWKWMKKHPYIDMVKQDSPSKDAVFYVYDRQVEAHNAMSRVKRMTKLMNSVFEMSLVEKRNFAEALGLGDSAGLSEDEVELWIEQKANGSLSTVEDLLKTKDTDGNSLINANKLYHEAMNKGIIKRYQGSWIRYGGEQGQILGRNEESVIQFLLNTENADMVTAIRADIAHLKD